MQKIAKFEKVSYQQFSQDSNDVISQSEYDELNLPKRATSKSAGYDFYLPYDITIDVDEEITIASGIRAKMNDDWVLQLYPRSSLGFKYQLFLANTVGIIDADYYDSNNEGHILIKLINKGNKKVQLKKGDRFVQGVFLPYGICVDDEVILDKRNGGIGSSGSK